MLEITRDQDLNRYHVNSRLLEPDENRTGDLFGNSSLTLSLKPLGQRAVQMLSGVPFCFPIDSIRVSPDHC